MKSLSRIVFLALLISLLPLAFAWAEYPERPIQILVPATPGGDTDFNARLIAAYMDRYSDKPVVVFNVTGDTGLNGIRHIMQSPADGYTVLFYHTTLLLLPMFGMADYSLDDFVIASIPLLDETNSFVVPSNSRFKNLNDVAEEMRSKDKSIIFSVESGGVAHMDSIVFSSLVGREFRMVDVGSQALKNARMMAGKIDMTAVPVTGVRRFVNSGQFRPLGVMAAQRHPAWPDVPTFREQGFDMVHPKPYIFAFPKGTPADVVQAFNRIVAATLNHPETKAKLDEHCLSASPLEGKAATDYLRTMQETYREIAAKNGVRPGQAKLPGLPD